MRGCSKKKRWRQQTERILTDGEEDDVRQVYPPHTEVYGFNSCSGIYSCWGERWNLAQSLTLSTQFQEIDYVRNSFSAAPASFKSKGYFTNSRIKDVCRSKSAISSITSVFSLKILKTLSKFLSLKFS